MRVGLSILTRDGHNIWSNGIDQNVYHLACLLDSIPFIEKVVLLDCGNLCHAPDFAGRLASRFPIIPLFEANDAIDIAIEVSGGLNEEWGKSFRARGGKVVFHICGHPYASLVEPTTFDRAGFFSKAERCDEVWILQKDRQFMNMLKAIHRCPVYEVPYLWHSVFLDNIVSMMKTEEEHFGYKPGSLRPGYAEPAIFEPNISPLKAGLIPFLICEQMARLQPDSIRQVHLMNSAQFAVHPTFVSLVGHSILYRANKVLIKNRDYFSKIMGAGANLVVSHQIMWSQNYLYLDALYGDYPLVHNSPLFSDVGYYYADSDIEAGCQQMWLAMNEHDHNLASYKANSSAKISSLSPYNQQNQDIYARRLLALNCSRARRAV